jgi:Carboxypeptidase regulatory-like domain/TonB dependent receptor/TonB-dependent Receptor Plug Domain
MGMRFFGRLVVVVLVLSLCWSLPSIAQTITGTISGDVTDTSGAVVASATITVENLGTNEKRTATTTTSGSYRVPDLAIGKYKVTATAPGFKTVVENSEVLTGAVTRAEFKLQVGQRTETVEVEGSAPLVDLSPNNNNYIDNEKIENVPLNGRDFTSLLAITPGVQRAPGGGYQSLSINGARTTSNNFFIDGLYNNDRYYGEPAINETGIVGIPAVSFPPEAIAEMSVQETPSAEFGVKGGAPILLDMKSGTNAWHGSGTWVNHSGFGDAVNYFAKHNSDNCASAGECEKTPIHNNQFNGTIGGPIVRDKAFLFLYYEGQRYRSADVASRVVPTPQEEADANTAIVNAGLTPTTVGQNLLAFFPTSPTGILTQHTPATASANSFGTKFDFKVNASNSIAVRYIFGDSLQTAPGFGLPPASTYAQNFFNSVAPSRAQMAGLSWTWNLSSNKILESRLGYTRFSQLLDVNNKIDPKSLGVDTGPLSPADFGVPYVYLLGLGYGGYIGGVQEYPLSTRPDSTWDWSEHFSWVKGNHTIKLGGNFQHAFTSTLRNNARSGFDEFGYVSVANYISPTATDDPVTDAIAELLLGKADFANRNFGDSQRYIYQNSLGFYGQDDWKITPHLTLTYGLRWEINGALSEKNHNAENFIPGSSTGLVQVGHGIDRLYNLDLHDFGPRAGFAWDVFGNGKTALRAGYSLTYDVPDFGTMAAPHGFAGAHVGAFTQPHFGVSSVAVTGDVGNGISSDSPMFGSCYDFTAQAGDYICLNQGPVFGANPSGTPPFNAFAVVQNFKTPRYHNFNLSIQQQLFRNNVLTVAYSGQRGHDLVILRDLNANPLGSVDADGNLCSGTICNASRPFSQFGLEHIIQATNAASSQYDSLQASYNQRGWHGFDTEYNLTWSKCFDDNSFNRGGAGTGDYPQLQNPFNPRESWGLCDHDVRFNFNASGVYAFATIPRVGKYLGKGWEVSSIYTALSGRPFTVIAGGGGDPSGQGLDGNSIRAAWDGTPIHYNTRNPDAYVVETYTAPNQPDPCGNVSASGGIPLSPFYIPCPGTVGNSRRNQLIGPGLSQWDMSLIKATQITERMNVELRWEVYNLLNRGNFYYFPNNILNAGGFAQIKETSDVAVGNPVIAQGGPRNMNFSLKFIF